MAPFCMLLSHIDRKDPSLVKIRVADKLITIPRGACLLTFLPSTCRRVVKIDFKAFNHQPFGCA
jgi:hypothetical protein